MHDALSELVDHHAIVTLIQNWGLWRDTQAFDALRAAYAPGATMKTTWFDGPADEFVDASIRMAGQPGPLVQHFFGAATVEVAGDRSIAETRLILMVRGRLDDVEVDVTCYGRFCDRLVRRAGRWAIASRIPIYEKDSLQPVVPGQLPRFDDAALQALPAGYRHLAYLQSRGGARITLDLPAHNSEAQATLYRDARAWLRMEAPTA